VNVAYVNVPGFPAGMTVVVARAARAMGGTDVVSGSAVVVVTGNGVASGIVVIVTEGVSFGPEQPAARRSRQRHDRQIHRHFIAGALIGTGIKKGGNGKSPAAPVPDPGQGPKNDGAG
jgi:hypothetical protein